MLYLGIIESLSLKLLDLTETYLHHQDNNSECYFIGEILSNEKLTYQAFQRFKQDYQPKHLLFLRGNYQVVVRIGNRIWLFSDLGNVRPIYYSQQHNYFLFSSRLNLIHQHLNTPINIPWFQRALSTSGFHLETETPYKNIYVIPGGWGLLINQNEQKLFQAWEVDQELKLSFNESKKKLRQELVASVLLRCKERKNITTDLSGGLDSSTLTWIAATQYPIKSLTIEGKEESEDIRIAKEITSSLENIDHYIFQQNQIPTIYSNMDQIYTDIPIPFFWSANKAQAKFRWARKLQSEIHFSGEGGDSVLCANFTYLADLIQQFKWRTLFSHAQGWARQKNVSTWSYLIGACRLACRLPFTPGYRHSLSFNNLADWFLFPVNSIQKRRFSKYHGVSDTIDDIHYLGYVSHGLKDLARQEQVYLAVPYLDHNVLHICLRLPSEEKMTPNELKPLLKSAFPELPTCLLERRTKGDYTADVYAGMKQHFDWFQKKITSMYLADMGLVDLPKFQECFDRLAMGVPVPLPEFHQTLSIEMWLRQKEEKNKNDHSRSRENANF